MLSGELTLRQERFTGVTLKARLEEQGPVRAVIRLDGRHRSTRSPGMASLYFAALFLCRACIHPAGAYLPL